MIPVGYMAKRVEKRPDWLKAEKVVDLYSVSGCTSENFTDYINHWKHNGYGLFDSPKVIQLVAEKDSVDLGCTTLFYYEAYEKEFNGEGWRAFLPLVSFPTNVIVPEAMHLEGFDVVTFFAKHTPECSPLSCNSIAEEIPTNSHCLLDSFEEAKASVGQGKFNNSEPGPYRIFAVYSVEWGSL